jgi:hypothetical protein
VWIIFTCCISWSKDISSILWITKAFTLFRLLRKIVLLESTRLHKIQVTPETILRFVNIEPCLVTRPWSWIHDKSHAFVTHNGAWMETDKLIRITTQSPRFLIARWWRSKLKDCYRSPRIFHFDVEEANQNGKQMTRKKETATAYRLLVTFFQATRTVDVIYDEIKELRWAFQLISLTSKPGQRAARLLQMTQQTRLYSAAVSLIGHSPNVKKKKTSSWKYRRKRMANVRRLQLYAYTVPSHWENKRH